MPTDRSPEPAMTVVLDPGHHAQESGPVLDMRGRLDPALFQAALDRVATDHPVPHTGELRLRRHGPDHHTLELPAPHGAPAPYPAGLLADLITGFPAVTQRTGGTPGRPPRPHGALPQTFAVTHRQRELLAEAAAGGPDHQVEQLVWRWHGPLDTARFTEAWQSVFDRETVLRSAFAWDPHPRAVLFESCDPQVAHHVQGTYASREELMAAERERGFDLRRPGLLRVALLDGPPGRDTHEEPLTDVLLTYHRVLLDGWSVRVLLREFYRAYLAGGVLPGGERRPDLRDYVRWLDRQDPAPAREFWRRTAGGAPAALPRTAGAGTSRDGTGRNRIRLSRAETTRLAHWAARWGVTESGVLHAVWAMLLYRASVASGAPADIGFGVSYSGRGLLLDDIERTPGPFAGPLPMSVEVDPAGTVPDLLRTLRDRTLETAAYEWVPPGLVREWLGQDADPTAPETLLSFEHTPRRDDRLAGALAAHGVHVDQPVPAPARTAAALTVVAHHDGQGGLALTSVHDRARLPDDTVRAVLSQAARLLRRLPYTVRESTTVAEVLGSLPDEEVLRLYDRPARTAPAAWLPLRPAARPGAATVCLIAAPGAPDGWYRGLLRCYDGPEALAVLRAGADPTPGETAALASLAPAPGRLVLGGFSGAGAIAYALARRLAESGRTPPPVVLSAAEDHNGPQTLATALHRAATM
ncbi:condensation domain-containing protein [Streptomyces sp. NPDC053750]|uniref:condensation domain-containing protein n=1 Tax=Streptomyces sp. NPDC053750 TaxID=3365714 RepID=UPI0037D93764